ncbi:MAG TPA: DNA polymerase III subunit delta, partial [Mobilitalea sp.]|nr:DNA polymerase III subunit delta [Mobilitalea sp.]
MKVIKEHIKSGNFKQFYLLYGSEGYLKNLYRGKLITAILGDDSAMNFTEFVGKNIDLKEFNGVAQTLPFFSNQRLILVENSGLFKNQSDMVDLMK